MTVVRNNRSLLALMLACSMSIPVSAPAQAEFDRGKALYDNHCKSCHDNWVHLRESSKINTTDELRRRVAGWSIHSGLKWGNGEINDVTDYLNHHFYKLTETP